MKEIRAWNVWVNELYLTTLADNKKIETVIVMLATWFDVERREQQMQKELKEMMMKYASEAERHPF